MEDKINQALVQLENELQGIVSAREQVEKTVKSSTDLQKVVGEYVSTVKTFCVGLQSWEADLKEQGSSLSTEFEAAISRLNTTCSDISSAFHSDVVNIATGFKKETENQLSIFNEQNKKLSEKVLELNTLRNEIKKAIDEIKPIKDSLSQLSKDLKDSQKEQDIVLDDIKQKVTDIPVTIKGFTDAIADKLETINQELKTILDSTNTKIDLLNEKGDYLKSASSQILSVLQSSTTSIASAIATSKKETAKSITINRWIIIIGIIMLAVLQVFLKYGGHRLF